MSFILIFYSSLKVNTCSFIATSQFSMSTFSPSLTSSALLRSLMSTPSIPVLSLYKMCESMSACLFSAWSNADVRLNETNKHKAAYNPIFSLDTSGTRVLFKPQTGWLTLIPDRLKAQFTTCIYPLHYLSPPMFPVCCSLQGTLHTASQWVISLSTATFIHSLMHTHCHVHTETKVEKIKMNKPRQAHTYTHTHTRACRFYTKIQAPPAPP